MNKMYLTADEIAELLGVSKGFAYRVIRELNVEIKISAFISNDEGVDYYDVQVSFNLKSGKCIDVRSDIINDSKGIKEILNPYSQIKFPFDDRGDYPGYYSSDIEKDSPFTDEDIVVIQFKDKSVEYHLKDIAEKEGIQ